MRLWLLLALFMLIFMAPMVQANELWLIIVNQYGEPVSDKVQVIVIGGKAELYNETYWLVRTNSSKVLVKVYRIGLYVGEFQLRPNSTYRLRVLVGDMLIQAPRSLTIRIKLLGTNHTWLLTGEPSYIIEDLPYGTYELEIIGTNFRNVIYWEGGVISIGRTYKVIPKAVLKAVPFMIAPALGASAYKLRRRKRHRRRKVKGVKEAERAKSERMKKPMVKRYREAMLRRPETLTEALLMTEA